MPQQQIALYRGPRGFEFPKLPTRLGNSSRNNSSGNKPSLKNSDVLKLLGDPLPTDFNGSAQHSKEYFAGKAKLEQLGINITTNFVQRGIAVGEDLSKLDQNYWNDLTAKISEYNQAKNQLLRFHAMAEQDRADFKASDLYKAASGAMLTQPNGDPLSTVDVVGTGANAKYMFDNDKYSAATWFGFNLTKKEIDAIPLNSEKDIENAINTYGTRNQLTKEARIKLQDYLPLGFGWDDTTFVDSNAVMEDFQKAVAKAGKTKTGKEGSTILDLNEDEIRGLVNTWIFNSDNPNTKRWIREQADNKKAAIDMVFSNLSGKGYINKLKGDFNIIDNIRSALGLDSYDGFVTEPDIIAEMVDNSSMDPIDKKHAKDFLSRKKDINLALLYHDRSNANTLSQKTKENMFYGEVGEDLVRAYSTKNNVSPKNDDQTVAENTLNHLENFDIQSVFTKISSTPLNEPSDVIAHPETYDFFDRSEEAGEGLKYLKANPKATGKEFFTGEDADLRVSPISYYHANSDILNKFTEYVKKHPNVIDGITLTGESVYKEQDYEGMPGDKDRRSRIEAHYKWIESINGFNNLRKQIRDIILMQQGYAVNKPNKYFDNMGLYTTTPTKRIGWNYIIQTKGFKKWVENNLTEEEKKSLYDKDKYIATMVKGSIGKASIENQYAKINEERLKQYNGVKSGKLFIENYEADPSINNAMDKLPYTERWRLGSNAYVYDFNKKEFVRSEKQLNIIGFKSYAFNLEATGSGKFDGRYIYPTVVVAMSKDDMEGMSIPDLEGGETTFKDIYANDEHRMSEHINNPYVQRWIKDKPPEYDDAGEKIPFYNQALGKTDDMFFVDMVIRMPYASFVKRFQRISKQKSDIDYKVDPEVESVNGSGINTVVIKENSK